MTTSALRRQVKNIVHNYSEAEIKVREATSNDPWGPSSSLMSEIGDLTFNVVAFTEVMGMIWKRLNDHGKNWRHVYKALTLLDYLIKTGSDKVAHQCKENVFTIQTLKDFQFVDRDGKDQGINVREKAKQLVALMRDEERLKQERANALKTKERMSAVATGISSSSSQQVSYPSRRSSQPTMSSLYGEEFGRSRGSPSSYNSSSSSPHLNSDLEQARPQTSGEEELQLQLALAMSREECEKPQRQPPSTAVEIDEDTELQIALSLSKEQHEKDQRSRQGDHSLLQKALEESRLESEDTTPQAESALLDLVDIFGPVSSAPPAGDPWDITATDGNNPWAEPQTSPSPPALPASDPWDTVGTRPGTPATDSWSDLATAMSSATSPPWPSKPWGSGQPHADPWETPASAPSPTPNDPWGRTAGGPAFDPFVELSEPGEEEARELNGAHAPSTTELDLFGELFPSTQINGTSSPDTLDLKRLGDSLAESSLRNCRTPESFLDPSAASLVNLDSLIPAGAPVSTNPFLSGRPQGRAQETGKPCYTPETNGVHREQHSRFITGGLSAPSPTNPFHCEQPRLTLNQMRTPSGSPQPGSLSYSTSLPLPLSSLPTAMSLPSSLTQPPASGAPAFAPPACLLDIPSNLPQPLLPMAPQQPGAPGRNPFL
ncbi:epsin-3-like isoform X1 [Acipenser oxyrinchus oxyrinchus]|uniref:Epsin-3-like isoform X1 n=1 Tax=Acipenser oxyrinchus oxyrinchus TaxID=40147 RepID=A0AAD8D4E4_ACIOX|nr:epsin-3-like isoform X1 [Acipenser oxyrinchus oxyrinchus]